MTEVRTAEEILRQARYLISAHPYSWLKRHYSGFTIVKGPGGDLHYQGYCMTGAVYSASDIPIHELSTAYARAKHREARDIEILIAIQALNDQLATVMAIFKQDPADYGLHELYPARNLERYNDHPNTKRKHMLSLIDHALEALKKKTPVQVPEKLKETLLTVAPEPVTMREHILEDA